MCFRLAGETFPVSVFIFDLTVSPLVVSPPTQECSDSGWQVKAGGSEGRPDGGAQTQTKQLEMLLLFFFCLLSLSRLISAIFSLFLYVSPSMPVSVLHSCLFVEKQKRRKCLAFYLFCFFLSGFCFHASHLPWSHSLRLPLSLFTPLFSLSLLSHVMNIMIVLPRLMIILQCEGHCSNNLTTDDVFSASFKWATLAPLFLSYEEMDTDCAVGGVGSSGLSLLCTSKLLRAPIFVYDTPDIFV